MSNERLGDEVPDTVDYFRDRMSGHVRSVSRNFWGRVVLRGLTRVDRYLVLLVAKASEEVTSITSRPIQWVLRRMNVSSEG